MSEPRFSDYHDGLANPLGQLLYDRVGVTELARAERLADSPELTNSQNAHIRALVTEALEAKVERLQIRCGVA